MRRGPREGERTEETKRWTLRGRDRRRKAKKNRGWFHAWRESYNSPKHNPRMNLTSPGREGETMRGGDGRRGKLEKDTKGREREKKDDGGCFWADRDETRFLQVSNEEGSQVAGRRRERKRSERLKVRGRREAKRFGASTIILQSSATTRRAFLPPRLRTDVQIALMADQREKPCPDRYLSFPKVPCVFRFHPPPLRHPFSHRAFLFFSMGEGAPYRWNRGCPWTGDPGRYTFFPSRVHRLGSTLRYRPGTKNDILLYFVF